jgi:hypothetical protein
MQKLSTLATTPDSARGLYEALSGFRTDILETEDQKYLVGITLVGGNREMIDVLNAIEQHVTERGTEPARISLSGRTYSMHPYRLPQIAEEPGPWSSRAP